MKVEGTLGGRGNEQRQDWAFFCASPEQFCPVESKDKLWAFWFHSGDCLMQKTGSTAGSYLWGIHEKYCVRVGLVVLKMG